MNLGIQQHDPVHDGVLEVEVHRPNYVEVFFVPPDRSLAAAGLDPNKARDYRTKLLDINGQNKCLTIHPIGTRGDKPDFLQPKYGQIERITLEVPDIFFLDFDVAFP